MIARIDDDVLFTPDQHCRRHRHETQIGVEERILFRVDTHHQLHTVQGGLGVGRKEIDDLILLQGKSQNHRLDYHIYLVGHNSTPLKYRVGTVTSQDAAAREQIIVPLLRL